MSWSCKGNPFRSHNIKQILQGHHRANKLLDIEVKSAVAWTSVETTCLVHQLASQLDELDATQILHRLTLLRAHVWWPACYGRCKAEAATLVPVVWRIWRMQTWYGRPFNFQSAADQGLFTEKGQTCFEYHSCQGKLNCCQSLLLVV